MNSVSKKTMKQYLAGPYLIWMTGFTIIPLLLIAWYGLTDAGGAFTLENIAAIATQEHSKALFLSLGLSLLSTGICLLLAYPLAMILRKKHIGKGSFIVFIRMVLKPREIPKAIKVSIREMPVTISEFKIGMLLIPITMFFGVRFMLLIPIAARVPRIVAARAEIKAIRRVL